MQPQGHEDARPWRGGYLCARRSILVLSGAVLTIGLVTAAIAPARHAILRRTGEMMAVSDKVAPADLLVIGPESEVTGGLAVADLYKEGIAGSVAVLTAAPTAIDREFARRGVRLPDLTTEILVQLGIPKSSIIRIPAGDGGTTETTASLANWAREHQGRRVIVIVGPTHGRRYRRVLRRVWPAEQPMPAVVTTPHALFRPDDWWQSRTTLREGLMELEKLLLDYVRHPL